MRPAGLFTRVILLSGAAAAACAQTAWDDTPVAHVRASPKLNGDVALSAVTHGISGRFDLATAAHRWMGCDWVRTEVAEGYSRGTCRHMFAVNHGRIDGSLQFAYLVLALRTAGVRKIELYVDVDRWPGQPLEEDGGWVRNESLDRVEYRYTCGPGDAPPPPLRILLGSEVLVARPLIPFLAMISICAAAALALRYRAGRRPNSPVILWVHWIQLASWLLWLIALPPSRIAAWAAESPVQNLHWRLLCGALLYCAPLAASAIALSLLRRAAVGNDPPAGGLPRFLRLSLLPDTALAMLTGFPVIGMALSSEDGRAPIAGCVLGVTACAGIMMWAARGRTGDMTTLETGALLERTRQMAAKGGVRLKSLCVLRGRGPHEANAFAWMVRRQIFITDSLIEKLTRRELDAVIAHELGHLRGRSRQYIAKLFWVYLPIYFALWLVMGGSGMFYWAEPFLAVLTVPIVFVSAAITRRREFHADVRSAEVTGDPWGMIAGLARLVKMHHVPAAWGALEGSILSHPSFRRRAQSLALRFQIPIARALAILDDPDILEGKIGEPGCTAQYYSLAAEVPKTTAFSQAVGAYVKASTQLFPGTLILLSFGLSYAVAAFVRRPGLFDDALVFLLGLPLVLWLSLRMLHWSQARFMKKMTGRIGAALPAGSTGDFVGLWPGDAMNPVRGFFSWDLGRIRLTADRITYAGESARFSLPRAAITGIEIVAGPRAWNRRYGILIRWEGGSFVVRRPGRGSRRYAAGVKREWNAWWKEERPPLPEAAPEFALPDLPVLAKPVPEPAKAFFGSLVFAGILWVASLAVATVLPDNPLNTLAEFATPLLYAVAMCPSWIPSR